MDEMMFDPDHQPETKAELDAYVAWCADELLMFVENGDTPRTYRTAFTCAGKLLVVTTAQMSLDPRIPNFPSVARNIAVLHRNARAFERARIGDIHRAMVGRAMLDCWEPQGKWSPEILVAAKCAASAIFLTLAHPLRDLWDLDAPDAWTLVLLGYAELEKIVGPVTDVDCMVNVNESVVDRMQFQRASDVSHAMGGQDVSPN